jgi:hypothetical protein
MPTSMDGEGQLQSILRAVRMQVLGPTSMMCPPQSLSALHVRHAKLKDSPTNANEIPKITIIIIALSSCFTD